MNRIGLFFGSFNPIHTGHLIIAQYMLENADIDGVWFVVSPHNPFKKRSSLAHEQDRYDLVQAAIYENYRFRVEDIEFHMPQPSYTADTLALLIDKHPEKDFSIIMGTDSLSHIHKWKNANYILENHQIWAYPRPGIDISQLPQLPSIHLKEAPLIDISATLIRQMISEGKSIKYIVPDSVEALIFKKKLYI